MHILVDTDVRSCESKMSSREKPTTISFLEKKAVPFLVLKKLPQLLKAGDS